MSALCQKQTLPDSLAGRLRQPQATDYERLQDANASIPKADVVGCQFSAMCGRLRVGKENLHVTALGRCSHVFGL